jgi:hypothetical protein
MTEPHQGGIMHDMNNGVHHSMVTKGYIVPPGTAPQMGGPTFNSGSMVQCQRCESIMITPRQSPYLRCFHCSKVMAPTPQPEPAVSTQQPEGRPTAASSHSQVAVPSQTSASGGGQGQAPARESSQQRPVHAEESDRSTLGEMQQADPSGNNSASPSASELSGEHAGGDGRSTAGSATCASVDVSAVSTGAAETSEQRRQAAARPVPPGGQKLDPSAIHLKDVVRVFPKDSRYVCPECKAELRVAQQCEILTCCKCFRDLVPAPDLSASTDTQPSRGGGQQATLAIGRNGRVDKLAGQGRESAVAAIQQVQADCRAANKAKQGDSFSVYQSRAKNAAASILAKLAPIRHILDRSGYQKAFYLLNAFSTVFEEEWPDDMWSPRRMESGWRAHVANRLKHLWLKLLPRLLEVCGEGKARVYRNLITCNLRKMLLDEVSQHPQVGDFVDMTEPSADQEECQMASATDEDSDSDAEVDAAIHRGIVIPVEMLKELQSKLNPTTAQSAPRNRTPAGRPTDP